MRSSSALPVWASSESVRTRAIDTALARMPLRASSLASDLVSPMVLARVVAVASRRLSPTRPESPIRLTMAPPPLAAIWAPTTWQIRRVPATVTSIWGAQSASVVSKKGFDWVAAALLTSTPIGPSSAVTRSTAASTEGRSVRSRCTAMALTPRARASAAASVAPAPDEL